jgi:hypothetical protein
MRTSVIRLGESPNEGKKLKFVKTPALAGLAIAAIALIGAASATAESTQLCENDAKTPAECKEPMSLHYVSKEKAVIKTSVLTTECDVLYAAEPLLGLVTNGPVILHVTAEGLVVSNCTNSCTIKTLKGGLTEELKEGEELASVKSTGFELEVSCSGLINCVYGSEGLIGHVLGPLVTGDNGHVTYNEALVKKVKGFLCPNEARMTMLLISLLPAYIRS